MIPSNFRPSNWESSQKSKQKRNAYEIDEEGGKSSYGTRNNSGTQFTPELPNLKVPQVSLPSRSIGGLPPENTKYRAQKLQPNDRNSVQVPHQRSSRRRNGPQQFDDSPLNQSLRSGSMRNHSHSHPSSSSSKDKSLLPHISGLSQTSGGSGMNSNTSVCIKETPGSFNNNYTSSEEHNLAGCTSIKGLKPGNPLWINQDNFFINENFDNRDVKIFCVLDGHGEHGHHVSRYCRERFPAIIKSANLEMVQAFAMMQNELNSCEYDVKCSGATCVLATIEGAGKLSVYNCGDSRAVLGRRNQNGVICAHALSLDHKPDRPDERKRVLNCGGHLGCRQVLVNQPGRGPVSMPVGPCRVWYQHRGETLGLAMSRSLGDSVVHKSGVSAEPEILEHMIDSHDEFVILATDGVWDVVDNNGAVQMVVNFVNKSANWNPTEASHCITKYARGRWEKLSLMVDDITCIVVKLPK